MIKRIIIGLLISVAGFMLLEHNEWLIHQTGSWDFAERNLGGTRFALKIISVLVFIIGLMIIFGLHTGFLKLLFGSLLKAN